MKFITDHYEHDDAVAAALLFAGAMAGLMILTIYANTLSYETTVLPSMLRNIVPWQEANLRPEPWESQLYHLGVLLIPFCAVGTWLLMRKPFARMSERAAWTNASILSGLAAIGWLVLFFGTHTTQGDLFKSWGSLPWQSFFFVRPSTLFGVLLLALVSLGQRFLPDIKTRWSNVVEWTIVCIVLLCLVVNPNFLLPVQDHFISDDHWFLTVSQDILFNKHLLVSSQSQYGLLPFYLLALAFKIFGTSLATFKGFLMVLHFAYYLCLYAVTRTLFRSRTAAIAACIFILGFSILRIETHSDIYTLPSLSRWRNFCDIFVIFMFAREAYSEKRLSFLFASIFTAIAFFWNADIGISTLLMTILWAVLLPLFTETWEWKENGKRIGKRLGTLFLCVLGLGLVLQLSLFIASGSWPDWGRYFFFGNLYSSGFGAMPMPAFGSFWIVLAIYATAIVTSAFLWLTNRRTPHGALLFTIAGYGLIVFHYYLNRSFITNLWAIALPAGLCGCLLFAMVWRKKRADLRVIRHGFFGLSVLLFVANAAAFTEGASMALGRHLPTTPPPFDDVFEREMKKSVAAIQSATTPEEGVAIISQEEGVYLIAAGRKSAFNASILETVFTISDLQLVLDQWAAKKSPVIFVEHEYDKCPRCDIMKQVIASMYEFDRTEGLLDVYVLRSMKN